jgi:hypothetical protein
MSDGSGQFPDPAGKLGGTQPALFPYWCRLIRR